MHLFQPPQPGWAVFITSLLVIGACFVREKAHSNGRKDTKDMSSVFVGCKFGRCYFDINSVLLLIVRMHQMLRRVENKRVRCTVSKSDALFQNQMHCFKIRCTGVSLTMQIARDRVVQPNIFWATEEKINLRYGWYQSWRSNRQCDIRLPSSSIESYLKG